jgi:hypothetical protein
VREREREREKKGDFYPFASPSTPLRDHKAGMRERKRERGRLGASLCM